MLSLVGLGIRLSLQDKTDMFNDQLLLTIPFSLTREDIQTKLSYALAPQEEVKEPPVSEEVEEESVVEEVTFETVGDDYFQDALFIGDSRTAGLEEYAAIPGAEYFAQEGMTVFNALTQIDGTTIGNVDLPTLLASRQFGKIYVMLGINELGYPFNSLMNQYTCLIDTLKKAQPDSIIYICGNLNITASKSGQPAWLNMETVRHFNDETKALCDNQQTFYIDINEKFCNEQGYLRDEVTGDGVHPYASYYVEWKDWYYTKGIIKD